MPNKRSQTLNKKNLKKLAKNLAVTAKELNKIAGGEHYSPDRYAPDYVRLIQ